MVEYAKLIVVGFPSGFNFGLDLYMWKVGDKFRGITEIPPGVHFIYYSGPGDEFRQGFFLDLKSGDVIVRKWDSTTESLTALHDECECERIKAASTRDFHFMAGIAPFSRCMDAALVSEWQSGSNFIDTELVVRFGSATASTHQGSESTCESKWSSIGKLQIPTGLSPFEVSRLHLDKITHLFQVVRRNYGIDNVQILLGELQLCFIEFLLGQNYEAFLHWRELLELFLGCTGIENHQSFFTQFLQVLHFQIKQIPNDILVDPIFADEPIFLIPQLTEFLTIYSEIFSSCPVRDSLERIISEKFGPDWQSHLEGPTIV